MTPQPGLMPYADGRRHGSSKTDADLTLRN